MRIVLSVIQYLGTKVNKKFIPGIIKSFIKYSLKCETNESVVKERYLKMEYKFLYSL